MNSLPPPRMSAQQLQPHSSQPGCSAAQFINSLSEQNSTHDTISATQASAYPVAERWVAAMLCTDVLCVVQGVAHTGDDFNPCGALTMTSERHST